MKALALRKAIVDLRDPRVDMYARAVLHVIAAYARGETNEGWCSQETIADSSGVSERQVRRALKRLRELGYIATVGQHPVPRGSIPIYRINIVDHRPPRPAVDARPPAPPAATRPPAPQATGGLTGHDHRPVASATTGPPGLRSEKGTEKEQRTHQSARTRARSGARASGSSSSREEREKPAGLDDLVSVAVEAWQKKHPGKTTNARELEPYMRKLLDALPLDEAKARVRNSMTFPNVHSLASVVRNPSAFVEPWRETTSKTNGVKQHAPAVRPAWMGNATPASSPTPSSTEPTGTDGGRDA